MDESRLTLAHRLASGSRRGGGASSKRDWALNSIGIGSRDRKTSGDDDGLGRLKSGRGETHGSGVREEVVRADVISR